MLHDKTTLSALLAHNVGTRPDVLAVTEAGRSLSWREFARLVDGFSAQLAGLGVGRGDRVAMWLPNGLGYLLGIFAVARRGAVTVHVNTRFGIAEVGDLIARTSATLLITRSQFAPVDFMGQLERIDPAQIATLRTVISFDPAPATIVGRPVLAPVLEGTAEDLARPDDAFLTFTTGGTTARPKLVVHTQRSIARHACEVGAFLDTGMSGAALLAVIPFCGTYGNAAAMAMVAGGGHLVCMDAFDPAAADGLVRAQAITHLIGDDRMVARLAKAALDGVGPHRGIRFFGVAVFNPDAPDSLRLGLDAGFPLHSVYGSSEVQALYAIGDPALGGTGPVTLVSAEADLDVVAESGELMLSGPSMFSAYLDDTQARGPVDGWFRTGDLADRAGTHAFLFHGRAGDMLRLGGFLVNPQEIEAFLHTLPGVGEAQVVGVEAGRGIAPFAFIIAAPGAVPDEAALLRACQDSLARFKVPVRAVTVAAYPTSNGPNGPKIARAELRRMAAAMLERAEARDK